MIEGEMRYEILHVHRLSYLRTQEGNGLVYWDNRNDDDTSNKVNF